MRLSISRRGKNDLVNHIFRRAAYTVPGRARRQRAQCLSIFVNVRQTVRLDYHMHETQHALVQIGVATVP